MKLKFRNYLTICKCQATTATAKATGKAVESVINVADDIDNDLGRAVTKTALMVPAAGVAVVGVVATTGAMLVDAVTWPFK